MPEVIIRKGDRSDVPQVLGLIRELAEFEKAPEQVTNTIEAMMNDGFGEKPVYGMHVAELDGRIVGMAVYFVKYSTWKGKGLFLDDLFVTERHRGGGIGTKLFMAFLEEAKAMDAKQAHWQVLDWNTPAIRLYERWGASIDATWHDCKFSQVQIHEFKP